MPDSPDDLLTAWLGALERRHLSVLTLSEVARALRALSSCYVERRAKLARGGALDSAGKRAAFALFYSPLHFLVTRHIVRALPSPADIDQIVDLGCGAGAAGAAWSLDTAGARLLGVDRHPWAVAEANWTYKQLRLNGRARRADAIAVPLPMQRSTAVLAAYVVNELSTPSRATLLTHLLSAHARGARLVVIEPIARGATPWWDEWDRMFRRIGGRADEWRFPAALPPLQRDLARSAGLGTRELTARSFYVDSLARQP